MSVFSTRLKAEEEPGNAVGVNVEVQKGRKMFTREIVSLMVNIYILRILNLENLLLENNRITLGILSFRNVF